MTRRYARWVAFTLLLGGCGDTPQTPATSPTPASLAITEFDKGEGFSEREDWDTAIACYTEAIRLKPDFADAYYNRGGVHWENGENDKAIKDYSEAIRLKPDYAMAYNNRGIEYHKKGENDQAIKDYAKFYALKAKE